MVLLRTGNVRGVEGCIDSIAALHPDGLPVIDEMRACLDSFDLKGLRALAQSAQNDAA